MAYLSPSETSGYYDYIIADGDNSDQKVIVRGGWADYHFYGFSPSERYLATRYKPGANLQNSFFRIYDTKMGEFIDVKEETGVGYYDFREWKDGDSFLFYKIGNEESSHHKPKSLWFYSIEKGEKYLLAENVD